MIFSTLGHLLTMIITLLSTAQWLALDKKPTATFGFCLAYFFWRSLLVWLGCQGSRTCDQQVTGSKPGRHAADCNPGQVVYIHVPLSSGNRIWYHPMSGDARGGNCEPGGK